MLVIFDLDDCLIHEGFEHVDGIFLFPETLQVLQYLKLREHDIAIASHNDDAIALLKKNKISQFFSFVIGFQPNTLTKIPHLTIILDHFKGLYDPEDCVYFDDLEQYVIESQSIGMNGRVVSHLDGVTLANLYKVGL